MTLTYFSCSRQSAGNLQQLICEHQDAYRHKLPRAPIRLNFKIPPHGCQQHNSMRHLCLQMPYLKCQEDMFRAKLRPLLQMQREVEALIEGESVGCVSRRSNHHFHMTLELKGPRSIQFEIEFDRFALTPWPCDKGKRTLRKRFICGWATCGFDHVGHSLSAPKEGILPLGNVPTEPVFATGDDDTPQEEDDDGNQVQYHRCCSCDQRLPQTSFSRTQLRKCANKRRCSNCTQ